MSPNGLGKVELSPYGGVVTLKTNDAIARLIYARFRSPAAPVDHTPLIECPSATSSFFVIRQPLRGFSALVVCSRHSRTNRAFSEQTRWGVQMNYSRPHTRETRGSHWNPSTFSKLGGMGFPEIVDVPKKTRVSHGLENRIVKTNLFPSFDEIRIRPEFGLLLASEKTDIQYTPDVDPALPFFG